MMVGGVGSTFWLDAVGFAAIPFGRDIAGVTPNFSQSISINNNSNATLLFTVWWDVVPFTSI